MPFAAFLAVEYDRQIEKNMQSCICGLSCVATIEERGAGTR
jgi:hypothetical protein